MKTEKKKTRTRFEGTEEINADHCPVDKERFMQLLSHADLKKQKKGTQLFSVSGKEIVVGKDNLDLETFVFGN